MSFPCAFSSLAKAAIANVCEVARLLILKVNDSLKVLIA
jgi:hypothetical protein